MLLVKLLNDKAKMPQKAKLFDAGFDVFSCEEKIIGSFERHNFGLGIAVEFPRDYMLMVSEKSGMAAKLGIQTIGNIIDSGYRGEIHAILQNLSPAPVKIEIGQKIAQIILLPCYTGCDARCVNELSDTDRKDGGFGSTGCGINENPK
jgi:dUTP pyrophosphatase